LGLVATLATPAAAETAPYHDMSTSGAAFLGPGRELEPPDTLSVVRLGLTGPALSYAGRELQAGVALAVDEANRAGGYRGLQYQVVFRPDDGPWGRVAAQAIALIREDQVWAIIAALDGERAHAAELVAAKLWAPIVTPGAGDRTIDYANVPWVFRLMPDDRSQADLLLSTATTRGWRRLVVVTEGTRDGRAAGERLGESAHALGRTLTRQLEFTAIDPAAVVPRVVQSRPDAVVVWARPDPGLALLRRLRQADCQAALLVPAPMVGPELAAAADSLGGLILGAAPLDLWGPTAAIVQFRQAYVAAVGRDPSPVAAYAYEATRVVLNAVDRAGLNRARIRDELAATDLDGLTGMVRFDGLGGYPRRPVLAQASGRSWQVQP
jgi:ABC-type branched-subunit amino acid transport system substrate-binding protein